MQSMRCGSIAATCGSITATPGSDNRHRWFNRRQGGSNNASLNLRVVQLPPLVVQITPPLVQLPPLVVQITPLYLLHLYITFFLHFPACCRGEGRKKGRSAEERKTACSVRNRLTTASLRVTQLPQNEMTMPRGCANSSAKNMRPCINRLSQHKQKTMPEVAHLLSKKPVAAKLPDFHCISERQFPMLRHHLSNKPVAAELPDFLCISK